MPLIERRRRPGLIENVFCQAIACRCPDVSRAGTVDLRLRQVQLRTRSTARAQAAGSCHRTQDRRYRIQRGPPSGAGQALARSPRYHLSDLRREQQHNFSIPIVLPVVPPVACRRASALSEKYMRPPRSQADCVRRAQQRQLRTGPTVMVSPPITCRTAAPVA